MAENKKISCFNIEFINSIKHKAIDLINRNKFDEIKEILDFLLDIDYVQLFKMDPLVSKKIIDIATLLIKTKNYEKVEQIFVKYINVMQKQNNMNIVDFIEPLNNLAILYQEKKDISKRDEILFLIVQIANNITDHINSLEVITIFMRLGSFFQESGHLKAVEILYKQIYRFSLEIVNLSNNIPLKLHLILLKIFPDFLKITNNSTKALNTYEFILSHLKKSNGKEYLILSILNEIGSLASNIGNISKAEKALTEGLTIFEKSNLSEEEKFVVIAINHNLAVLYLKNNIHEKYNYAETLLKHSLNILENASMQNSCEYAGEMGLLAEIAEIKMNYEKAELLYNKTINILEKHFNITDYKFYKYLNQLGLLYLNMDRALDAVKIFKKIFNLYDSFSEKESLELANAKSHLALAYFKLDDFDNAISLYTQSIKIRMNEKKLVKTK